MTGRPALALDIPTLRALHAPIDEDGTEVCAACLDALAAGAEWGDDDTAAWPCTIIQTLDAQETAA